MEVSYKNAVRNKKQFTKPADACEIINSIWNKEPINLQKQFVALYLNIVGQLIGWRLISTGTMDSTVIDIKFLISLALHCMTFSVIVCHNYPSVNLLFSNTDKRVTAQINEALKLIDVSLLDHLILTEHGYLSIQEKGFF
jgi:DNA repair protein RadC